VTKPPQRGGKREGAGRKPAGRKPYLVRMNPATMAAIRARAQRLGLKTPGAVLDQDYAPSPPASAPQPAVPVCSHRSHLAP
jgi:hypothetical protein